MTESPQELDMQILRDEKKRVAQMDDRALAARWLELEDKLAPLVDVPHTVAPEYARPIRELYARLEIVETEQAERWRTAMGIREVPTDPLGRPL